jgi:hypothetical protein
MTLVGAIGIELKGHVHIRRLVDFNLKVGPVTPMISCGTPLNVIALPITFGSEANRRCQNP